MIGLEEKVFVLKLWQPRNLLAKSKGIRDCISRKIENTY